MTANFRNGPPSRSIWEVETRLHEDVFELGLFTAPSARDVVAKVEAYWSRQLVHRSDLQGDVWIARVTYVGPVLAEAE